MNDKQVVIYKAVQVVSSGGVSSEAWKVHVCVGGGLGVYGVALVVIGEKT